MAIVNLNQDDTPSSRGGCPIPAHPHQEGIHLGTDILWLWLWFVVVWFVVVVMVVVVVVGEDW